MPNAIVLKPGMNNVLELGFPHAYQCRVVGFYHDQSIMLVEVRPNKDTHLDLFYIVFENVQYFEGVTHWSGANLRVATRDEHFEFTMKNALIVTSQELLIFEADNQQIRLLAGNWIALLDDMPERFR